MLWLQWASVGDRNAQTEGCTRKVTPPHLRLRAAPGSGTAPPSPACRDRPFSRVVLANKDVREILSRSLRMAPCSVRIRCRRRQTPSRSVRIRLRSRLFTTDSLRMTPCSLRIENRSARIGGYTLRIENYRLRMTRNSPRMSPRSRRMLVYTRQIVPCRLRIAQVFVPVGPLSMSYAEAIPSDAPLAHFAQNHTTQRCRILL